MTSPMVQDTSSAPPAAADASSPATAAGQPAAAAAPSRSPEIMPEEFEVKEEFSADSYDEEEIDPEAGATVAADAAALPTPAPLKLDQNRLLRQLLESDGSFSDGQPSPVADAGVVRRRPISGQETSSFLFGDDKARYEFLKKLQQGKPAPSELGPK